MIQHAYISVLVSATSLRFCYSILHLPTFLALALGLSVCMSIYARQQRIAARRTRLIFCCLAQHSFSDNSRGWSQIRCDTQVFKVTHPLKSCTWQDVLIAVDLSRKTFRRIWLNYVWALGYNCAMIPLAAGALYAPMRFQLPPWVRATVHWIYQPKNATPHRRKQKKIHPLSMHLLQVRTWSGTQLIGFCWFTPANIQ